jgi:hypothetical protein
VKRLPCSRCVASHRRTSAVTVVNREFEAADIVGKQRHPYQGDVDVNIVPADHVLDFVSLTFVERFPTLAKRATMKLVCEFFPPLVVQVADFLRPSRCGFSGLVK